MIAIEWRVGIQNYGHDCRDHGRPGDEWYSEQGSRTLVAPEALLADETQLDWLREMTQASRLDPKQLAAPSQRPSAVLQVFSALTAWDLQQLITNPLLLTTFGALASTVQYVAQLNEAAERESVRFALETVRHAKFAPDSSQVTAALYAGGSDPSIVRGAFSEVELPWEQAWMLQGWRTTALELRQRARQVLGTLLCILSGKLLETCQTEKEAEDAARVAAEYARSLKRSLEVLRREDGVIRKTGDGATTTTALMAETPAQVWSTLALAAMGLARNTAYGWRAQGGALAALALPPANLDEFAYLSLREFGASSLARSGYTFLTEVERQLGPTSQVAIAEVQRVRDENQQLTSEKDTSATEAVQNRNFALGFFVATLALLGFLLVIVLVNRDAAAQIRRELTHIGGLEPPVESDAGSRLDEQRKKIEELTKDLRSKDEAVGAAEAKLKEAMADKNANGALLKQKAMEARQAQATAKHNLDQAVAVKDDLEALRKIYEAQKDSLGGLSKRAVQLTGQVNVLSANAHVLEATLQSETKLRENLEKERDGLKRALQSCQDRPPCPIATFRDAGAD